MAEKTIKWANEPTEDDLIDAQVALTLVGVFGAALDGQGRALHPAKDLLRFARLPGLPQNNAGVAKWLHRIKSVAMDIPPVLLVRGDLATDRPLIIAEGYHRVSACHLLNEATPVAGFFLNTQPSS